MAKKPAKSASKGAQSTAKSKTNYIKADLLKYYEDMLAIRRFEERAGQLYGQGLIGGFCHLYIGQEAVVVGLEAIRKEQDTVITSYRDHGHMLAVGMDPNGVMAELTGRIGGYSKGKGGSMHMFSREKKFFGGHGIVGAQTSIGTGMAFAHKYLEDDGVCFTYMGDGAANQGQFFESMNMAQVWGIPVVYVIENNQYAMGTSTKRHAAGDFCDRGASFGIPGAKVDGMDVLAVVEAGEEAAAYARKNQKPFVLEMETYRYRGHSMSDPAKYREKSELEDMKTNRDPIDNLKALMVKEKLATEDDLKAIDKQVKETMLEAVEFAKTSPEPDPSELWTDVLIEEGIA